MTGSVFFASTRKRPLPGEAAFTMIELMIVVAIIAIFTALAIPSISSHFRVSLNSTSREMASTIKETYNSTVVTGLVHRMVYDLKEGTYWVEVGPKNVLLDTRESRERDARRKRFGKEEAPSNAPAFQLAKTVTRKKKPLPLGVSFEDVLTQQSPDPITEGTAYTHFFPHGLIEQTIVHLKDNSEHHASLVITPVIGNTELYERYITGAEAFGK